MRDGSRLIQRENSNALKTLSLARQARLKSRPAAGKQADYDRVKPA
jgi:hypothetical protein